MFYHCKHLVDTNAIIEATKDIKWQLRDRVFSKSECTKISTYPTEQGMWTYNGVHIEIREKGNTSAWYSDEEHVHFKWSRCLRNTHVNSDLTEGEKVFMSETKKFMDYLDIQTWRVVLLHVGVNDNFMWHRDSPLNSPANINITLKEKTPILIDDDAFKGEILYDTALMAASRFWHNVATPKKEDRQAFKIIPMECVEAVAEKMKNKGLLGDRVF